MSFNTPIALIIFNRPDYTQKLFDKISEIKPSVLYLIADGPREKNNDDAVNCDLVRKIFDKVSWKCELIKDFSDTNLGCGRRPYTGISNLFDTFEEAIILEDDCIPHSSFFRFSSELLEKYRDDTRVMQISGFNYINKIYGYSTPQSYHFHKAFACWGWATWRRVWEHYDYQIKNWPLLKETGFLADYLSDESAVNYANRLFDETYANSDTIDYWDYQLWYAIWSQNGLAICPNINLVENVGILGGGTHFNADVSNDLYIKAQQMEFPLNHPPFILRDAKSDQLRFQYILQEQVKSHKSSFIGSVKQRLKNIFS